MLKIGLESKGKHIIIPGQSEVDNSANAFSIRYRSERALKVFVCFKCEGSAEGYFTEEFFIEAGAGEFKSFVSLPDSEKVIVLKLHVENLESQEGTAEIGQPCFFRTAPMPQLLTLENDLYSVGVDLAQGGAISHIMSNLFGTAENHDAGKIAFFKESSGKERSNLVNIFDKGRLIQQSYYGIDRSPYPVGSFFGNVWRFNPVQSGDKYGNGSKIVWYEKLENRIYVKVRPLDWGKSGFLTDTYMENVYSFEDGCIKVENRFVDFSMFDHSVSGEAAQERPAFYPIAPLDRFIVFSDGGETCYPDLKFWGEPDTDLSQRIAVPEGMSAWVNAEGFGLGLFTPASRIHLAGRYKAGEPYRCAAALSDPVSYSAAIETVTLQSLKPYGYIYYIAAGKSEEIYRNFKAIANNNLSEGRDDEESSCGINDTCDTAVCGGVQ